MIKALKKFSSKYTATNLQVVKLVDKDGKTIKVLKETADKLLLGLNAKAAQEEKRENKTVSKSRHNTNVLMLKLISL